WLDTFVKQKEDEKFDAIVKRERQLTRLIMANYTLELVSKNINGFRGRQAFLINWAFESGIFLLFSILFFTFVNIQLYHLSALNFSYSGHHVNFDFFYYTLKKMTFGDIELIKPLTVV